MGGAGSHARRLQALVHPIHAIVAFDHFPGLWIPLGGSPWAGRHAGLTADAQILVNENDAIAGSLLHSACWTGRYTPRILAVKARHKDVGCTGKIANHFRPDLNDLAQSGTRRQIFIGFTLHFTGMTPDTLFGILKKVVFAHLLLFLYVVTVSSSGQHSQKPAAKRSAFLKSNKRLAPAKPDLTPSHTDLQ
jgi:hypothetical protein